MKWIILYKMGGLRIGADEWRYFGRCSDEYTANGIVRDIRSKGSISDAKCIQVPENDRQYMPQAWR